MFSKHVHFKHQKKATNQLQSKCPSNKDQALCRVLWTLDVYLMSQKILQCCQFLCCYFGSFRYEYIPRSFHYVLHVRLKRSIVYTESFRIV